MIFRITRSVLFQQRLSFSKEAREAIERIHPPLQIIGKENIPAKGPCLLTVNHYFRPGFGAWWIAMGIAGSLPVDSHWMMASAWTYPNQPLGKVKEALTHWAFVRVARVLNLTAMPPMPPRPQDTVSRANAVRQVITLVRQHPHAIVGMAPEGSDSQDGKLMLPASGVGRFIFQLARLGFEIIPVGVYEAEGFFWLNFGCQYRLQVPGDLIVEERDGFVRRFVMIEIAKLVPEHLRGNFGDGFSGSSA